jgi:hypothetical protein
MSDTLRRTQAPPGVRGRLEALVGQPNDTWITVARSQDGELSVIFPPTQVPTDGVRLLEGGIHRLCCGGCPDCVVQT